MGTFSMWNPNFVIIFIKPNFSLEMIHQNSPTGFPADAGGFSCCLVFVVGIFLTPLLSMSHNDLYSTAFQPSKLVIHRKNKIQLAKTSQNFEPVIDSSSTLLSIISSDRSQTGHIATTQGELSVCSWYQSPYMCTWNGCALLPNILCPCREDSPITGT